MLAILRLDQDDQYCRWLCRGVGVFEGFQDCEIWEHEDPSGSYRLVNW